MSSIRAKKICEDILRTTVIGVQYTLLFLLNGTMAFKKLNVSKCLIFLNVICITSICCYRPSSTYDDSTE